MAFLNQVVMSLDNSFKVNNATGRVKLEMVKGKSCRVLTDNHNGLQQQKQLQLDNG